MKWSGKVHRKSCLKLTKTDKVEKRKQKWWKKTRKSKSLRNQWNDENKINFWVEKRNNENFLYFGKTRFFDVSRCVKSLKKALEVKFSFQETFLWFSTRSKIFGRIFPEGFVFIGLKSFEIVIKYFSFSYRFLSHPHTCSQGKTFPKIYAKTEKRKIW